MSFIERGLINYDSPGAGQVQSLLQVSGQPADKSLSHSYQHLLKLKMTSFYNTLDRKSILNLNESNNK